MNVRRRDAAALLLVLVALSSCNAPAPPQAKGLDVEAGPCGRGFLVVSSNNQLSTNVSAVDFDGRLLTPSLASSATEQAGLSAPLSSDVVLPTSLMAGPHVVLLDRFLTSVISWVDVRTASFAAQLSVTTGFKSNPRDYVEVSPNKAYVTRFEANPKAGGEALDGGNDLLIVDPSVPAITGRIDLMPAMRPDETGVLPRADRAVLAADRVLVVLSSLTASFTTVASSRIAVIHPEADTVEQVLTLDGLRCCSGIALSPSGSAAAVTCLGECDPAIAVPSTEHSGIAIVEVGPPLRERQRIMAAELGHGIVGFYADFASEERLLTVTMGHEQGLDDALVEIDLASHENRSLRRSAPDDPFTLGEVRCAAECGACFLTDAARTGGVLHRLEVGAVGVTDQRAIVLDDGIGLPPRYLGRF